MQIRKVMFLPASFLISSLLVFAQIQPGRDGRIKFDITYAYDNQLSLPGVFVLVHSDYPRLSGAQRDVTVRLDNKGQAEATLRPGIYAVFISKAGFVPTARAVEVKPDGTTDVIEKMTPDLAHSGG